MNYSIPKGNEVWLCSSYRINYVRDSTFVIFLAYITLRTAIENLGRYVALAAHNFSTRLANLPSLKYFLGKPVFFIRLADFSITSIIFLRMTFLNT
jgi:hypothetical protein